MQRLTTYAAAMIMAGAMVLGTSGEAMAGRLASNTITVSKDRTGDFSSLAEALASVSGAGPDNPYIIKVGPGVFEAGALGMGIRMSPHVFIEGSGVDVTVISGSDGVVVADDDTRLSGLTVRTDGAGRDSIGIMIHDARGFELRDVKVVVAGGSGVGYSASFGLYVDNSSVQATALTIVATGGTDCAGLYLVNGGLSEVTVSDSTITDGLGTCQAGIYAGMSNGRVLVRDSEVRLSAGTAIWLISPVEVMQSIISAPVAVNAVQLDAYDGASLKIHSAGSAFVSGSMLDGTVTGQGGEVCVASYDGNYRQLDASCR